MKLINNIIGTLVAAVALSGFLSSCSVEKYQQPELNLPEAFSTNLELSNDTLSIAKITYKDFFKDPILIKLLDKAMAQNNDIKVAIKQIEIASLGYTQSKWANLPTVNATLAGATVNRPSDNSMNGQSLGYFLGQKYIEDYTSAISISWEADIWGKIKGAKEVALSDYLQTQEAAKAVKTRVVQEVVTGYYNLLMLDKQLAITTDNVSFADSTLIILKKQYDLGMITSLAVQQQQMVKDQIVKRIPEIQGAIKQQENALSILTGSMPDRIERQAALDNIEYPKSIGVGVPSEMLSYRPDVKSAELQLRKSIVTAHINKVRMYPALNITAQGGLNALKASDWFAVPGSLFGMVGGSLVQPLLNGKQLKTQYKQSQIAISQAEINFKQSVLYAVGEVSDALVNIDKLEQQELIAKSLVEQADVLINNSLKLYKYGQATYLDVILAQSNKLQAELDLANIKTQRLNAITLLYRSLGGGWQ